jgi:hypothetical protein
MMPRYDVKHPLHVQPPHTASLLIDAENFFLPLWAVRYGFRHQHTAGSAIFTQVLLIAVAIASIANDILAAAFPAAMGMSFGNHADLNMFR